MKYLVQFNPENNHRERACDGKKRFPNLKRVENFIRTIQRKGREFTGNVYKCPYCLGYHIGYQNHERPNRPRRGSDQKHTG